MMNRILVVAILAMMTLGSLHAQTSFSKDSADACLKILTKDIGPRTMGSPGLHRAVDFALRKFREFGLQEAYRMPVSIIPGTSRSSALNTNGENAIGVLHGKTNRTIVIGAHIDSESPDHPGANDNASGTATVIELARILSRRVNESTIVFALFDGEEQGLIGSKEFVKRYERMSDVVLMLQLDMADGRGPLELTVDSKAGNTPKWLVRACCEELAALGYSGMNVMTHFMVLNSAASGGIIGSDHAPFLESGIPAIDLGSSIDFPIHTPQDIYENVHIDGLKRSGDLVYKLVERYDVNIPEEKEIRPYILLPLFGMPVFIDHWLLYAFVFVSVVLSVLSLFGSRERRPALIEGTAEAAKETRPKIPGLKLLLLTFVIALFVCYSEDVVGMIKGLRHPWLTSIEGYYVLAASAGIFGLWSATRLAAQLTMSKDVYRYYLRAVIWFLVLISGCIFLSIEFAAYLAFGLFMVALAMTVRKRAWVRYALYIVAPYLAMRLIFSEGFAFISKIVALNAEQGLDSLLATAGLALGLALWVFPFALSFAAIYLDMDERHRYLRVFSRRAGLYVAGGAFAVCVIVLAWMPAFSREWKQIFRIEQLYDLSDEKGSIVVSSSEYMRNVKVHIGNRDTLLTDGDQRVVLKPIDAKPSDWLETQHTITTTGDSIKQVSLVVHLVMKYRPYRLRVVYEAKKDTLKNVDSPIVFGTLKRKVSFRWYSFPDSLQTIPVTFSVSAKDTVTETIEAEFLQQLEPVTVEKELATYNSRTIITKKTNLTLLK
jgi:hypothetical protein